MNICKRFLTVRNEKLGNIFPKWKTVYVKELSLCIGWGSSKPTEAEMVQDISRVEGVGVEVVLFDRELWAQVRR
jgi:hypothetical protein